MSKTHEDPGGHEYDRGETLPGFSAAEIAARFDAETAAEDLAEALACGLVLPTEKSS